MESEYNRDAWKIRWILAGLVKEPPSIDAILGKEQLDGDMELAAFTQLLRDINQRGKWDA